MQLYKNGYAVDSYETSYSGRNIYVSIDSSKSNTGMMVWDEYGNPIDDYEISGAGNDVDVYDLCYVTRLELRKLFDGAKILEVGIEDIITKKEKGYKGLDIHQSRYKITAVFDNFIFFFQDMTGRTPRKINNWEWKSHILPEQFRTREHEKGSKDWCAYLGNRWADRKDDVCDAYCIGLYLVSTVNITPYHDIVDTVPSNVDYEYGIFPKAFPVPTNAKNFIIKNEDTLSHNIETVSMKIDKSQSGVFEFPITRLISDDIYGNRIQYSDTYKFERTDENVIIIVLRK